MQFIIDTILFYPIWTVILGLVMLVMLIFSRNNLVKFILILATPTTAIAKLKKGKSEIKGKVQAINIIEDSGQRAVYHKYIEEYYESGDDGGWEVESEGEDFLPFNVVDETGTVLIKPDGATVDLTKKSERLVTHSTVSRTKNFYILDGDEVYILGDYQKEGEDSFITKKEDEEFLISNENEGKLLFKYGFKGTILLVISILIIGIALSSAKTDWLKSWEGQVTGKWVDDYEDSEGDDVYVYEVELDGQVVKRIDKDRWINVKQGDYLAKFKGSYEFEIMDGRKAKVVEKKTTETKKTQ